MDHKSVGESAITIAEDFDLGEVVVPSLGSWFRLYEIVHSPFQVLVMISHASLLHLSISQTLLHGVFGEQRLILLLGLDECFLEEVGV